MTSGKAHHEDAPELSIKELESGFTIKKWRVTSVAKAERLKNGSYRISGTFNDGPNEVGRFQRRLIWSRGTWIAEHQNIRIAKPYRGKKIGRRLLKRCFWLYLRLGVRRVILEADTDGRFVWPAFGFSPCGESLRDLHKTMGQVYTSATGFKLHPKKKLPSFGPLILRTTLGTKEPIGRLALERSSKVLMELDLYAPLTRAYLVFRGILD